MILNFKMILNKFMQVITKPSKYLTSSNNKKLKNNFKIIIYIL